MIFLKFKTIKYKNQKRKIKSKICGPLDESQNALVIQSKRSGALCISWSLVSKALNQLLNQNSKNPNDVVSLVEG